MNDEFWAVVRDFKLGHAGWYAVAWTWDPEITGSSDPNITKPITFSLEWPVWKEAIWPQKGSWVIIPRRYCTFKVAGWRALRARGPKLNEEPPEWTKTKTKTSKEGGEQEK